MFSIYLFSASNDDDDDDVGVVFASIWLCTWNDILNLISKRAQKIEFIITICCLPITFSVFYIIYLLIFVVTCYAADNEITFFNWQLPQISLVARVCYLLVGGVVAVVVVVIVASTEINNQF